MRFGSVCMVIGAFAFAPLATAQDAAEAAKMAQNKLLAKRAAEADCYRKLAETVRGLHITSETYVKDFVTESDVIQTELDTFIRGVRLGKPKWDSDLVCSVEGEVTVAKVIEELKSLHQRHYRGNTLKATDFEQITQHIKKDIIKAVGMGAPRPDLPPESPDLPVPDGMTLPEPMVPAIWKQVGPQARLMAKRAAEVDAMRKLVERIKGLRITSDTLVRDFVAESDQITAEARGTLVGAQEKRTYYHDEELICEVTYTVPVESVITTIKALHKRHYKGNTLTATDIEKITKEIRTDSFEATGMGVPPQKYLVQYETTAKVDLPDWIGQNITAEGKGVPPADKAGSPQGKLLAARAAELDAKRRLAEEVRGFRIDSSTMVRDFVTEHDEINTQLDAVLIGAYVKSTMYDEDGTATVVVEMPAMKVWEIVHTYVRLKSFS